MKTCARCGLVSPDSAGRCDCGFTFAPADVAVEAQRSRRTGKVLAIGGAVLFVFGVLESVGVIPTQLIFTLTLGTHPIDIGALIGGGILAWKGLQLLERSGAAAGKAASS